MNRANYDNKTLSCFNIVGAYFVDIFYNNVYLTSRDQHKFSGQKSFTEIYKNALHAYSLGFSKEQKYYEKVIKGLAALYRNYTKFRTIGLADFIDEMLQQYIPEEHYKTLSDNEKMIFIHKILTSVCNQFISQILTPKLMQQVIDSHDNPENTKFWLQIIIDIQLDEREQLYNKFVRANLGCKNNEIDPQILEKIRSHDKIMAELHRVTAENCTLRAQLDKAKLLVTTMYARLSAYEAEQANHKETPDSYEANEQVYRKGTPAPQRRSDNNSVVQLTEPSPPRSNNVDNLNILLAENFDESLESIINETVDETIEETLHETIHETTPESSPKLLIGGAHDENEISQIKTKSSRRKIQSQ